MHATNYDSHGLLQSAISMFYSTCAITSVVGLEEGVKRSNGACAAGCGIKIAGAMIHAFMLFFLKLAESDLVQSGN